MFVDESTHLKSFDVHLPDQRFQGYHYWQVVITQELYLRLKSNVGDYTEWLSGEHLGLTSEWLMRNFRSPVVDYFDIVRCEFTAVLNDFIDFMNT